MLIGLVPTLEKTIPFINDSPKAANVILNHEDYVAAKKQILFVEPCPLKEIGLINYNPVSDLDVMLFI